MALRWIGRWGGWTLTIGLVDIRAYEIGRNGCSVIQKVKDFSDSRGPLDLHFEFNRNRQIFIGRLARLDCGLCLLPALLRCDYERSEKRRSHYGTTGQRLNIHYLDL